MGARRAFFLRSKFSFGLAMWSSGRRPDQGGFAAAGPSDPTNGSRRSEASNSELWNVAPQGAAAAEAPKLNT
ncbi:hypothetical protein SGRA_3964 [Saprospira grandis str. Lewin]|uniref:Uncharacterized protein n=1 Tax=Saprospira grandis (strain Lewin) TaxID=984262 RepID=H6L788_SAPGL|nr:hypothetical protein SGRA_3964 [Saprospira grandis str. Lewin]